MFLRRRRTPQAPCLTFGGFKVQGVSRLDGAEVLPVRARSHATPTPSCTHGHALFQAPCFLWMWSLALVNLTAQWLSRNRVCAPGLADKRPDGVATRRVWQLFTGGLRARQRPASPKGCSDGRLTRPSPGAREPGLTSQFGGTCQARFTVPSTPVFPKSFPDAVGVSRNYL